MSSEVNKKSLIIIGAGMAGLTAGITWALNKEVKDNPVLIVEKNEKSGGCVTSYEREGYVFDTCQMLPNMSEIFEYLGIDIELRKFKGYYMRTIIVDPDTGKSKILELPSGVENFKHMLMEAYPNNREQIRKFLDHARAMYLELFKLKVEPSIVEISKLLVTCPKIIKNASKTFKEYFDQFAITEPEVIEIFNVFAAFSGLPAEQVSSMVPISAMNSLLDGAFRTKIGFIDLVNKFEKRYFDLGGELRKNSKVEKILIEEDNTVKGIRLDGGEEIFADNVISTVDTMLAMKKLIGLDVIRKIDKKYAKKIEGIKMSTSSMNIGLGLDDKIDLVALGMDCGYNIITSGGDSYDRLFELYEQGKIGFNEKRFHFGVISPSPTTGGKPNITIRVTPMALKGEIDWAELKEKDKAKYDQKKEELANFFIEMTEKYLIPDLSKYILIKEISTPANYAQILGSPTGSIYGMAPFPDNFGRTRLKMRTPIKGLYNPKFVHGVFGAVLAGMQVIDMILERKVMDGNARFKSK